MTRRSVGICPVCESKVLVRMRHGVYVVGDHYERSVRDTCTGSGLAPLPTSEQKARETRRIALIEPFRSHAAVALDARITHHDYPHTEIEILCRVSLWWYSCNFTQLRPHTIVRCMMRQHSRRADIYCTFCGVLLLQNVTAGRAVIGFGIRPDLERLHVIGMTNEHAIECALKHLAFALVPAAPEVRKLDESFLQTEGSS